MYVNLSIEETKERIHLLRIKPITSSVMTLLTGKKFEHNRKSNRST